jgi:hypothetical protein
MTEITCHCRRLTGALTAHDAEFSRAEEDSRLRSGTAGQKT